MFCSKCGAEIPNGSTFCLKCRTQLTTETAKTRIKIKLPKLGLPLLPLLGAVMLIVGPFLAWTRSKTLGGYSGQITYHVSYQGLTEFCGQAVPLFIFGAMVFVVMVLARGHERRLSALLTAIGALSLVLVFHFVYVFFDTYQHYDRFSGGWGDVSEGFYVVGVGAFLVTLSGCPLFRRIVV